MTGAGQGPAHGAAIVRLAVLLHGVGSDSRSMRPLAEAIVDAANGIEVLTPDAPEAFDVGEAGRQWFSVRGVDDNNRPARVLRALPPLRKWLDAKLTARGIGWSDLAVIGFSQGAMMGLGLLAGGPAPARVVALSGRLVLPVERAHAPFSKVYLEHGDADRVIPVEQSLRTSDALRRNGYSSHLELIKGQGHEITPPQMQRIVRALPGPGGVKANPERLASHV